MDWIILQWLAIPTTQLWASIPMINKRWKGWEEREEVQSKPTYNKCSTMMNGKVYSKIMLLWELHRLCDRAPKGKTLLVAIKVLDDNHSLLLTFLDCIELALMTILKMIKYLLENIRKLMSYTGLKITAGHRTMSGQIRNLTGQIFHSPVMLTGHIQQSHRNKRKFPRSSVVCDELK